MRGIKQKGFTIIEVLLFLAISGLMVVVLFVAISGSINRERYHDAVNSFTDFIQGQYNLADNVRNNRIEAEGCIANNSDRATSDCAMIGRLVVTNTDATSLISYPVISSSTVDITAPMTDGITEVDYLHSLQLQQITSDSVEDYSLAWQTAIVAPASTERKPFSMLIVRSPFSSAIKTYYIEGITTDIDEIIDSSVTDSAVLCLDPSGLAIAMTGVRLDLASASSAAVQVATAGDCR